MQKEFHQRCHTYLQMKGNCVAKIPTSVIWIWSFATAVYMAHISVSPPRRWCIQHSGQRGSAGDVPKGFPSKTVWTENSERIHRLRCLSESNVDMRIKREGVRQWDTQYLHHINALDTRDGCRVCEMLPTHSRPAHNHLSRFGGV